MLEGGFERSFLRGEGGLVRQKVRRQRVRLRDNGWLFRKTAQKDYPMKYSKLREWKYQVITEGLFSLLMRETGYHVYYPLLLRTRPADP